MYKSARKLKNELGYTEWRNFEGIIKRAKNLILHTHSEGKIIKTKIEVQLGSGSTRMVVDYKVDKWAELLISELSSSYKLNNFFSIRNETVVLQLVKKYCIKHGLVFKFQYRLMGRNFDCMIGNKILIEFDEPHHQNKGQKEIDKLKREISIENSFKLLRVTLEMDIIDIIFFIENELFIFTKETNNPEG